MGAYLISKRIVHWLAANSSKPRLIMTIGFIGGLCLLLPALFLGMVVGGNIGGGFGGAMTESLGLGSSGVPLAFGLGVAIVVAVLIASGTLLSAGIARLMTPRD